MRFIGKDTVWDRKNNKVLCQFVNGKYETEDERTIKILTKLGYKIDSKKEIKETPEQDNSKDAQDVTLEELSYKELQKMAKKKGIKAAGVKKEDLIRALA